MFTDETEKQEEEEKSGVFAKLGLYMGGYGMIGLHLAAITYALFSGYHGVNATAAYRSDGGLGMAAGIVGILTVELVLLSLYVAWHGQRITGTGQTVAAAITAGLGGVLTFLAVVADSQLTAGVLASGWLRAYLHWVLPASPFPMAIGAFFVHALSPEQKQARQKSRERAKLAKQRFDAEIDELKDEVATSKTISKLKQKSRQGMAAIVADAHLLPEVQQAIQQAAAASIPELLRQSGIVLHAPISLPGTTNTAGNYGRADGMDLDDLIEELALERAQELMAAANETPEEEAARRNLAEAERLEQQPAERVNGANFTNGRPHGRE